MKRLEIVPEGWPCHLRECRPGLFLFKDQLCLKDEYGAAGNVYNDAGEIFWGGTSTKADRDYFAAQPVEARWEEFDE